MNGPKHYREAERLMKLVRDAWEADVIPSPITIAEAQVHATLAQAAATAMATYSAGEMDARDYYAWHAVAGVKGEYTTAQENAPIPYVLAAPDLVGAMDRHTSTHGTTAANAEEYRVGDLVNVSQPKHPHWGTRGKVVGFTHDVPALVAVEYNNLGNCLYLAPSQLMHHTDFVKQDQEYFDAAEAADVRQIERELDVWAGDDSEALRQEAEDDARAARAATGSDETWERNDEWTAKGEL